MKIRSLFSTTLLLGVTVILALCRPSPVFALSTITASSAGDGVFLLQGIGIEDAAGFEIDVSYDTATLANPRVAAGPLVAGATFIGNPDVPGMVRIIIVRLTPVKGSGVIATLTFERKGASPGRITALSAKLATLQGALLPSLAQVNNPTAASAGTLEMPQGQEAPTGTTGAPTIVAPTITIAGPSSKADEKNSRSPLQAAKEQEAAAPESGPDRQQEPLVAARSIEGAPYEQEPASSEIKPARNIFSQKGALDRFEEYRGKRTVSALVSLFEQDSYIGFRQEPPVALSDGKALVRVKFLSTPGTKTSSDVAVMGARLLSLKRDPENTNTWIADLQPERGAYRASLTVSAGDLSMVYPLTIAPKVNIDRARPESMTAADYDRYLEERLAAKSPKLDLNGDGKWDYRDDYILTANYLDAVSKQRH